MYAIHPIPLSEIKAIRRHTPPLGWHHIVVVLVSGLTLPPLYFYKGGVKALISTLKQVGPQRCCCTSLLPPSVTTAPCRCHCRDGCSASHGPPGGRQLGTGAACACACMHHSRLHS